MGRQNEPSGETLLGSETLLDAEDVSQAGQARLEVELTRLGQVGRRAVEVERKEGRSALDRGLDHGGRGDLEHVLARERVSERLEHSSSDLHDGRSGLSSEEEVSVVSNVLGGGVLL